MASENGNKWFKTCSFTTRRGAEHYITVTTPGGLELDDELRFLQARYTDARRSLGIRPETAVFRRVFVSDTLNQAETVKGSPLMGGEEDGPVAVSIIEQPPLPAGKVALLAYHVDGAEPIVKQRLAPHQMLVQRHGRRYLWSTGLCVGADDSLVPAAKQTRGVFDELITSLAGEGGTLRDNCLRTWIYVKDINIFYKDMADSRRRLFSAQGMTAKRPSIASTGIGGACAHRFDLVMLDAYSALDLEPGQVSHLNDFERMCATTAYNVTFERGTRIAYSDRAHLLISGTASIDAAGQVVHPGSVLKQLEHALENVESLLKAGQSSLDDLMYLIVYVRDLADFPRVEDSIRERFPGLPVITVQAPVCRPDWLVEVEGIAVTGNEAPALPGF